MTAQFQNRVHNDMGRGRSQSKSSRMFDSDEDNHSTSSTGGSSDLTVVKEVEEDLDDSVVLENHLDAIYGKRSSSRECGLNALIDAFTSNVQLVFALSRYETLLHQYVDSIKRGSTSEVALAAHALGLLAITVGAGKITHQIIEESIPHLSHIAKQSCNVTNRISALESLAIITFVGGIDIEDTQKSMDILWQVSRHKGCGHVDQVSGITIPPPEVRTAALCSWSFLLTTIPKQQIDSFFVKQTLPVLLSLTQMDNRTVRIAAGRAIVVIFEASRSRNKNGNDLNTFNSINKGDEEDNPPGNLSSLDVLKVKIIEQMRILSTEAGGKGISNKERNSQRSSFHEFLAYIEGGVKSETNVKLQNGDALKIQTWNQTIQLNMLRRYLGGGFQKHMQVNSFLHDIFDFTPRQDKKQALSTTQKRMYMSPNSAKSKARTQWLNKERMTAQAAQYGHYGVGVDEGLK